MSGRAPMSADAGATPVATGGETACPRCGYDQRGVVRSWTDRCPLDGICAECGLDFAWRDVLHPAAGMPRWCVEARRPWRAWPSQLAGTLRRGGRPIRFWSLIGLHQPIRWSRLLAMTVSLALALLLLVDVATAAIAVADHRQMLRGGATSPASELAIFGQIATRPFSRTPVAGYAYPRARGGTLAVVGLFPRDYWRGLWLIRWPYAAVVLVTPVTTAIAFGLLPVARRRAKVQPRHIGRVAMYGAAVPIAALTLALAASTWSALLHPPIVFLNFLHLVAGFVLVAGTLAWWHAAVERYLRMERPWAVAICATSVGLLAPIAAIWMPVYLFGGW